MYEENFKEYTQRIVRGVRKTNASENSRGITEEVSKKKTAPEISE